jgi:serine phosphatase RsbU (regulator of sigma subunit)
MEDCMMLSYTDGLVELLSDNAEGGVKSAFHILESAVQSSPDIENVIKKIIETHNLKGNNEAIFDDITLLGIKFFA